MAVNGFSGPMLPRITGRTACNSDAGGAKPSSAANANAAGRKKLRQRLLYCRSAKQTVVMLSSPSRTGRKLDEKNAAKPKQGIRPQRLVGNGFGDADRSKRSRRPAIKTAEEHFHRWARRHHRIARLIECPLRCTSTANASQDETREGIFYEASPAQRRRLSSLPLVIGAVMTPSHLPAEVTLRRVNGMTLEVAEAGAADGPLVILLHGFPDLWQGWHYQIPPLVEAGFRVLLPNQRGYGKSDKPGAIAAYDLDVLAQDIVGLADSEGRPTFSVVGHDWGGIVAWWVAAQFPPRVERLAVLNAPHPGAFKKYVLRHPTQLLRSTYVGFFQLPWLPETMLSVCDYQLMLRMIQTTSRPGTFDQTDHGYLIDGWSQPGSLRGMLNYYRAIVRRSTQSLQRPVAQPALILFGTNDPAEEPGLARASQAYCDDSRLIELNEGYHWIQREEPGRVNAALLSFMEPRKPVRSQACDD